MNTLGTLVFAVTLAYAGVAAAVSPVGVPAASAAAAAR